MVKMRIIPILLLKNDRLVKTVKFGSYRDVGDPVATAKIYDAQRADELIILDTTASVENRGILLNIIKTVSEECFMPLGVGGGVRTLDDIKQLLRSGADKVIINSAAVEEPDFVHLAAQKFGSSTIVVSIDYKQNFVGRQEVFVRGGAKSTGLDPVEWAKRSVSAGAGEIVITSIDCDGMMKGLDLEFIRLVADAVQVPVICSGGVGTLEDFKHGLIEGHASAVGAGSIFHFTDQSIIKTRRYLVGEGVSVRR